MNGGVCRATPSSGTQKDWETKKRAKDAQTKKKARQQWEKDRAHGVSPPRYLSLIVSVSLYHSRPFALVIFSLRSFNLVSLSHSLTLFSNSCTSALLCYLNSLKCIAFSSHSISLSYLTLAVWPSAATLHHTNGPLLFAISHH